MNGEGLHFYLFLFEWRSSNLQCKLKWDWHSPHPNSQAEWEVWHARTSEYGGRIVLLLGSHQALQAKMSTDTTVRHSDWSILGNGFAVIFKGLRVDNIWCTHAKKTTTTLNPAFKAEKLFHWCQAMPATPILRNRNLGMTYYIFWPVGAGAGAPTTPLQKL